MSIARELLVSRIQSTNTKESLLALEVSACVCVFCDKLNHVINNMFTFCSSLARPLLPPKALEECMESLGREFRSEINKFRFLNELIKMVSKKYNGDLTPREVSERVSAAQIMIPP